MIQAISKLHKYAHQIQSTNFLMLLTDDNDPSKIALNRSFLNALEALVFPRVVARIRYQSNEVGNKVFAFLRWALNVYAVGDEDF